MRLMFRSCVSKALRDQRAHPDALGVAGQLSPSLDAASAPLRGREPRPAEDGRQVTGAAALASAAL